MSILFEKLDWPFCSFSKDNVECKGHRCSLGKCISEDFICDGKKDCLEDGSDETIDLCRAKGKCAPNEFKCHSGGCVPKTRFCDGTIDCPNDGLGPTDEPDKCSCRAYLE